MQSPIHPGQALADLMRPTGMTARALAKRIGLTTPRISEVLRGKQGMSARTAVLLESVFPKPASYWIGLQGAFDEYQARASINLQRGVARRP